MFMDVTGIDLFDKIVDVACPEIRAQIIVVIIRY